MTRPVFVLSARRSAVVPRNGGFARLLPHEIAAPVIAAALRAAGTGADQIDELIAGNALGAGGNPARLCALAANLPERVAGLSVDRQCCAGLDAMILGAALIASGQAQTVVAGGVESYSRRPLRQQTFADGSPPAAYDRPPFAPRPDQDPDMAQAADALARQLGITRQDQDDWAIASHARARRAAGRMADGEIVDIDGITVDAFTRDLDTRTCARSPVIAGSVTAANTAVAADAAAFCVLSARPPTGRIPVVEYLAGRTLGADPRLPGLAPVGAIREVLGRIGLGPADVAVAEIMEAYAAQAIACQRQAGLPRDRVNPGGGALARGHPIGASGAILAVRLWHELAGNTGTGLAAIAAAGGLGTAVALRCRRPRVRPFRDATERLPDGPVPAPM